MSLVTLPFATLEYKEPIVYFRVTQAVLLDAKEIIEVIETGNRLSGYKPHLLLTDARVLVDLTPEARAIGAKAKFVIAQAILVKWLAQRLIANVFLTINKPHYPMRIFNEEEKALKWLMKQKKLKLA